MRQEKFHLLNRSTCNLVLIFAIFFSIQHLVYSQSGLKEIAEDKKVFIGNLISNQHLDDPDNFRNGFADKHLIEEYNLTVLENYMKMSFVLPSTIPENINEISVEEMVSILSSEKIEDFLGNEDWKNLRKRGHAMIWFNQAPNWLNLVGPTWSGQEVFDFSRKYILALGQICGDRVDEWDVINESISDTPQEGQGQWRKGTWYRRANDGSMTDWGEATYENYIKMLFVWAREAQPNARLHLNDYSIELFSSNPSSKNYFMREKVKALKECGAPIDGVGFQSHFVLSDMVSSDGEVNQDFIDAVRSSMEDLESADIEVAITELDIRICNNDRSEAFQEIAFEAFCEMAFSQPNCQEILIWGLRDEDNWITLRNDGFFQGCQDAVIAEGDAYDEKAAYDGVQNALNTLPDKDEANFAPLNEGNGGPAECGGIGILEPAVLSFTGPRAVNPGDAVNVSVDYVAGQNQSLTTWFQLDSDPFTVYSQKITELEEGQGSVEISIDIPSEIPAGTNEYRYLAFIAPVGEGVDKSLTQIIVNRISVLGEGSQLIISTNGPAEVSQGETVELTISYSAIENQEVVVWFQLDQSPFTTYQEYRAPAGIGQNTETIDFNIPSNVPVAQDAYQYQTLLVPIGGGWPERISNFAIADIDVVMASNLDEVGRPNTSPTVYPNPSNGSFTIDIPMGLKNADVTIFSILGELVLKANLPHDSSLYSFDLEQYPQGVYWLNIRTPEERHLIKLLKN